jgi:hypothetical protein
MALFPLGILSAAGAGGFEGIPAYDLISTTVLGSASSSVTFSSLGTYSSTYKHLQIRMTARSTRNNAVSTFAIRINGSASSTYADHALRGDGSTALSSDASSNTSTVISRNYPGNTAPASSFGVGVIDLLDPYGAGKNKTLRTLFGAFGSDSTTGRTVELHSGAWFDTASITSIELLEPLSLFNTGSRFSLYGIKGA